MSQFDSPSEEIFVLPDVEIDTVEQRITSTALALGVLKFTGTRCQHGYEDALSLDTSEVAVNRLIRHYAGAKGKALEKQLGAAVLCIAEHPLQSGSKLIQGHKKSEPTFNKAHIPFWRFKPDESVDLPRSPLLRSVRIVYGIVTTTEDQAVAGLVEIINRGDFEKKYN